MTRGELVNLSPSQDSGELFDVVRGDGTPTGRVKTRAEVHRDGDWHRAIHVWVAAADANGAPSLLFQRRGLGKDTWPGRLDATVGGHFRAGETLDDALREIEEEIGLVVARNDLTWLGVRVCASEAEPGILDRELQDVFLMRDDRPLSAFRPHPAELAGLVRLPIAGVLALFAGDAETVAAEMIVPGDSRPAATVVTLDDFIPNIDRYFYRMAIAAWLMFRGERHVAV